STALSTPSPVLPGSFCLSLPGNPLIYVSSIRQDKAIGFFFLWARCSNNGTYFITQRLLVAK
ncbi:hypothetical protein, partial [Vibrio sp. 10N.247.311.47]|uniref:hypothetical protein n=1 Tax=Vibrio sp. 10N.247.311.47 TaxID=3229988 RepID=UPI003556D444